MIRPIQMDECDNRRADPCPVVAATERHVRAVTGEDKVWQAI